MVKFGTERKKMARWINRDGILSGEEGAVKGGIQIEGTGDLHYDGSSGLTG